MGHLWFLRLKIDKYVRQSDIGGDGSGPADLGIGSADLIGHACECETSVTLANYENLVDRNALSEEPGTALGRLSELTGAYSGIWWYADYPRHYAGDARSAS